MRGFLILIFVAAAGCSAPDPKDGSNVDSLDTGGLADAEADAGGRADATPPSDASTPDQSAPEPDTGTQPAYCDSASSQGFFSNCDPCDDNGLDCNTIDAPNASGKACGCSGGCPCGLSCGSYEIAPNVTVSDICVR